MDDDDHELDFTKMLMHVFIQFLAHENALNEWMDCFNWIIIANGGTVREERERVRNMTDDMYSAVRHISWSETNAHKTLTNKEWNMLDVKWMRVYMGYQKTLQ